MSLSCGFVGLPNVGKSTLFNAVLKKCAAQSANYPFCTIEPNTGHVPIDDPRLEVLAKIADTQKIVPALLTCVDIAGLVKGANKGQGLGNQFLGHIRQCDLIIQVLRCFDDDDIIHVEGTVDPLRDYEIISLELQFADIDKIDRMLEQKKLDSSTRTIIEEAKKHLDSNNFLNSRQWNEEALQIFNLQGLLTHKPMLVVANMKSADDEKYYEKVAHLDPLKIFATFELMLQEVDSIEDQKAMLQEIGQEESGLAAILRRAYKELGLITFFSVGKQEARAWKALKGYTMQDAAAVIHTDFYKSFISAEVVKYDDFVKYNGWVGSKDAGVVRVCSKTTVAEDGDICIFKTFVSNK